MLIYREEQDVTVNSSRLDVDGLAKKVGVALARLFNVTVQINIFDPAQIDGGTLKCAYCGQFTHNAEKCDYCGGVPI